MRRRFDRYEIWLPMVASVVLCVTFGILSYRTGRNHGIERARLEERSKPFGEAGLTNAPAQPNSGLPDAKLAARDMILTDLRREIAQKSTELEKLKAQTLSQQLALRTSAGDKNWVTEERDRLLRQVSADEETLRATQSRLKNLERERTEYVIHTASLETRVADLLSTLRDRERLTTEQQD